MSKSFKIGKHLFKEKKVGKKHYVVYEGGEIPIPAKLTRGNVDKIADYIRRMFRKQKKAKAKKMTKSLEVMKANKLLKPIKQRIHHAQPTQVEVKQEKKETVEHKGLPKIPNEYKINIEGIPKRFKIQHYHHGLSKSIGKAARQAPVAQQPQKLKEGKFEKEGKASDKKPKYVQEEPIMQKTGIHHFGPGGKVVKMKPREAPPGPSGMQVVKGELVEKPKEAKKGPEFINSPEFKAKVAKEVANPTLEAKTKAIAEKSKSDFSDAMSLFNANWKRAEAEQKGVPPVDEKKIKLVEDAGRLRNGVDAESSAVSQDMDKLIAELESFHPLFTSVADLQEVADEVARINAVTVHAPLATLDKMREIARDYTPPPDVNSASYSDLQEIADEVARANAQLSEPPLESKRVMLPHEVKIPSDVKGLQEVFRPVTPPASSLVDKLVAAREGNGILGTGIPEVQPLSLSEIQGMMKKIPGYLGTVMSDQLEDLPWKSDHDCCCIFNKSKLSDNDNGTHWESIMLSPEKSKSLEIYDSLAMPIQGHVIKQMENVIKRMNLPYELKLKVNGKRDQLIHKDGNSTNSCGFFAMEFLNKRANGEKFAHASGFGNPTDAEKSLIPIENRFKYLSLR